MPAADRSDSAYQNYRANAFGYFPLAERWIAALRADYHASRGDAPFGVPPFVDLRGIAYGRCPLPSVRQRQDDSGPSPR